MMRRQILNLHSNKPQPPRFCDVIVEGEKVTLELIACLYLQKGQSHSSNL